MATHSRPSSIHEGAFTLPVDPRVAQRPTGSRRNSQNGHHDHHHHHNNQDPKLFGPGFSSAPVHAAGDAQVRYVLVTPEMLSAIESGHAPQTNLVHPAGTDLLAPAPGAATMVDYKAPLHKPSAPISETSGVSNEKGDHDQTHELAVLGDGAPAEPDHPNVIARIRHKLKEPLGEVIGTAVLIIFGNGVNCQVVLSNLTQGSYLSISFGWGIGVMFGVYAAGGISGAHLNPAVTISLAVFRGFPWRKVPGYCLGQIIGAFLGSCLIQANYYNLINQYEGGQAVRTFGEATSTGALFFTAAKPYMTNVSAFFSEFFATGVLLLVILALGDANNNPAPAGMNGMILLFLIIGIGAALGTETAYCLNLARDWGPRMAAAAFGYPSSIWSYRSQYWLWCPGVATITGGLFGCLIYDLCLFTGPESPINRPWGKKKAQQQIAA